MLAHWETECAVWLFLVCGWVKIHWNSRKHTLKANRKPNQYSGTKKAEVKIIDQWQAKARVFTKNQVGVFGVVNLHLPNALSHPYQLDESIFHLRAVWWTFLIFIIFLIDIPLSKQCWPWSDAAFCGVWSRSALFAYVPKMGRQAYNG